MLERLVLAQSDMADAAAAARLLLTGSLQFRERRALEAGMFTAYARAFNKSKGNPPLPAAPTSKLTASEQKTHEWAIAERNMVWAHVDRNGHRRATHVDPGPPVAFREDWMSPSPEQLVDLEALAEKLHDRYLREAEELWRALRS
jgi:hypothetical protein